MSSCPIRILFQGDSITDAFRRPEEVNPAYQLGNGYAFLASSRLAQEFPGRVEFFNRGISGQTAQELGQRWDRDALALQPDVLSILIGVNATIRTITGEEPGAGERFESDYRSLVFRSQTALPKVKLVLIEPFLLEAGRVTGPWRADLRRHQDTVRTIASEFGTLFVPTQSLFDEATKRAPAEHWAYDGIHPTHAGAALLADAWIDATSKLLAGSLS